MLFGLNFSNFVAYIYHLIMGRVLGPPDYGELVGILALMSLSSSFFSFLGITIVKLTSGSSNESRTHFLSWMKQKTLIIGLVLLIGITLISFPLSKFLNIRYSAILLVGPIEFFVLFLYVYRSFLQGLLRFNQFVITGNVETLGRLSFGLTFVLLGFSVFGATLGILLSSLVGFMLASLFLRNYGLQGKSEKFNTEGFIKFSLPAFLMTVSFTLLLSMDVILVKHFFTSSQAGIYAAISTLGKIVFYATIPIASFVFPVISKRYKDTQSYKNILVIGLSLTSMLILGVLTVYLLFPHQIVGILYGSRYLEAGRYLILAGISAGLISLAHLITNFYFSVEKVKIVIPLIFASIAQIIGIWLFHYNFGEVLMVSIVVGLVLNMTFVLDRFVALKKA